jgi:diguanylate cyclase (GGDEF)-like protein
MPRARRRPSQVTATGILGRRDVALVAAYAIFAIATAASISAALKPDKTLIDAIAVAIALFYTALAFAVVVVIDLPLPQRLRRLPATYTVAAVILGIGLGAISVLDDGLANVYLPAVVLIATYLGLVVPRRWSLPSIAVIMVVVAGVHVLNPLATLLDVVSLLAMTLAGYLAGAFAHRAHGAAARVADVLGRTDALTSVLNRRGFFEEFEWEMARAQRRQQPLSLLVMDLDAFRKINRDGGLEAGDGLLRWVGATLARVLPAGAGAGRLGADEFAILLPGTDQLGADAIGARIGAGLAERIGASIGTATYQPSTDEPDVDALVRIADAELTAVKRGLEYQLPATDQGELIAFPADPSRARMARRPIITYHRLRSAGGPPSEPAVGVQFLWIMRLSWWLIAVAGAGIAAVQLLAGADTIWDTLLGVGAIPWVGTCLVMGLLSDRGRATAPGMYRVNYYLSTAWLSAGVGCVLLANDGILGPLVAALYLKVMADAFILPPRAALGTLAMAVGWWLLIVLLGPSSALWAVPYELGLFVASGALGMIAHRAFTDATGRTESASLTDALTGLRNRVGFRHDVEGALAATTDPGRRLAILRVDLNDFKALNDRAGHAAGDRALREVAEMLSAELPRAFSLSRLSGVAFAAAIAVTGREEAAQVAERLVVALPVGLDADVEVAVHPHDGTNFAALLAAASRRQDAAASPGERGTADLVERFPSSGLTESDPGIAPA